MSSRPVVRAPDPVLSQPAAEVDPTDADVIAMAADLVSTMHSHPACVGVAAPQIGVPWRMFCLDVSGHRKAMSCAGLVVLVNPRLVDHDGGEVAREGCLSVPDLTGDVRRATRVHVAGFAPGSRRESSYAADAFEARAFQHELDHLDGLLFLDRVIGAHALFARRCYR